MRKGEGQVTSNGPVTVHLLLTPEFIRQHQAAAPVTPPASAFECAASVCFQCAASVCFQCAASLCVGHTSTGTAAHDFRVRNAGPRAADGQPAAGSGASKDLAGRCRWTYPLLAIQYGCCPLPLLRVLQPALTVVN